MTEIFNKKSQLDRRRMLRGNMTVAERMLWMKIKSHQLEYKFRRQYGIGQYIVDFYCPEKSLVIEVDGDSHGTSEAHANDIERQRNIEALGIRVIRFIDGDVRENLDGVLEKIRRELSARRSDLP